MSEPVPTTPGTEATAAATSPRRSACAARARWAADAGRSAGTLRDRGVDQVAHGLGDGRRQLRWRLVDLRHRDGDLGLARERAAAGERLVRDDAQRVDVGRRGRRVPARLLRREVLHRAHHLAGRGQRNLVGDPGDAEVGDLDPAIRRDQQVAGFDVAVHEARGVGGVQRVGGLRDDVEHAVGREHALALEDGRQRLTGHEFHDQEGAAVFFAVVEDVGDALVVDQCGVPRLGAEPLEEPRVAQVLVLQDLDRDGATDDEVGRLPDLAHAADGDAAGELVSAAESEPACRSHLPSTASMTALPIGAAISLPTAS